jgi:integrase
MIFCLWEPTTESVVTRKLAFTPASIDALNQGSIKDPLTPGLEVGVLSSGKKVWKYGRRVSGSGQLVRLSLGTYPVHSIADARKWAATLNEKVELGIDPREALRVEQERATMTVARAHKLYMEAVREGRASRAKRKNKPRTISDKLEIYNRDIGPKLAKKSIYEVTERDLIDLVTKKGKNAKVRANRLAAELKVFFGWAASLRGLEVGLETDPARRLGDLRFPESPRKRKLSLEEIEWFLKAVAEEEDRDFRRGMVLWLLSAARRSELTHARAEEVVDGIWTIPSERSKNRSAHTIQFGPWGQRLMATNSEWVFPAPRGEGPRKSGWYNARNRVLARMSEFAGRPIERFTPHDFRRTARSNTKRLKVDFETAEAMLNHLKTGLERIYDAYELEDEKAAWFLLWENEIIRLARKANVASKLEVPPSQLVSRSTGQKNKAPPTRGRVSPSMQARRLA